MCISIYVSFVCFNRATYDTYKQNSPLVSHYSVWLASLAQLMATELPVSLNTKLAQYNYYQKVLHTS